MSVEERFWSKVDVSGGSDACWPWTACVDSHGYGRFLLTPGRGGERAHRVAWLLTRGPIPAGLYVCHRCDNKPCCNPAHHFLGTHLDNMLDYTVKGLRLRGEQLHTAKLTAERVREIRRRRQAGEMSTALAHEFGVNQSVVSRICSGKVWTHV